MAAEDIYAFIGMQGFAASRVATKIGNVPGPTNGGKHSVSEEIDPHSALSAKTPMLRTILPFRERPRRTAVFWSAVAGGERG